MNEFIMNRNSYKFLRKSGAWGVNPKKEYPLKTMIKGFQRFPYDY